MAIVISRSAMGANGRLANRHRRAYEALPALTHQRLFKDT